MGRERERESESRREREQRDNFLSALPPESRGVAGGSLWELSLPTGPWASHGHRWPAEGPPLRDL